MGSNHPHRMPRPSSAISLRPINTFQSLLPLIARQPSQSSQVQPFHRIVSQAAGEIASHPFHSMIAR